MKLDSIIKRIKLLRESNVKQLLPIDSCMEKMREAETLLNFTEEQNAEVEIINQAKCYFIIVCISSMEVFFKGMVEIFIEGGWFKNNLKDILRQDKITLADLLDLDKEKIKLGELISVSHSFQDLDAINYFFSKMVGCSDFLKEVSEYKLQKKSDQYQTLKAGYPTFERDISELVHLRHLIIHHDSTTRTISHDRLLKIAETLMNFLFASELYLSDVAGEYIK
jgi:hypothetical protein